MPRGLTKPASARSCSAHALAAIGVLALVAAGGNRSAILTVSDPQLSSHTLTHAGLERTYHLLVPLSCAPKRAAPLRIGDASSREISVAFPPLGPSSDELQS